MKKDSSEIAGWLGPTKKDMGVLGLFSYSLSSLMKRALLNEAVLLYTIPFVMDDTIQIE
jgi:hypothetical protein